MPTAFTFFLTIIFYFFLRSKVMLWEFVKLKHSINFYSCRNSTMWKYWLGCGDPFLAQRNSSWFWAMEKQLLKYKHLLPAHSHLSWITVIHTPILMSILILPLVFGFLTLYGSFIKYSSIYKYILMCLCFLKVNKDICKNSKHVKYL